MQTCHPHAQSFNSTILMDVIQYCRIVAEETANDEANRILPVIMPYYEWLEYWDSAWKSAMDYITNGLTTSQLYPTQ